MEVRPGRRESWLRRPWVRLRQAVQILALLAFLALFVASRRGGWPASLVNLPMRLDPLAILAQALASRTFLAGSVLALLTLLLTLAFGRAWCGWLCPLGTIFDLFPLNRWRKALGRKEPPPESWRMVKYGLLLAILSAALFANLSLMLFDPLTILFRTLSVSIWPAFDQAVSAAETALFPLPWLQGILGTVDGFLRPAILPMEPSYYRAAIIYFAVFAGVIVLNLFAPRFWCRYLCPLGALLGLVSKIAIVRRQVGSECKSCVLCTRDCPTGTIRPEKGYASDPSECTMCLECMEDCPRRGISFSAQIGLAEWNAYDPTRRQVLAVLGATIAGVALLRTDLVARRDTPHFIQPPGGRDNDLVSKCVRCGECMRACPTSGLQPSLAEAGLEGLWTPVLIPRLGYCDYSCNACGQVCPVQAIPPLNLDQKRLQVIGRASIDQNRCIAWADHKPCIVCEEMCPLPEKAVWLEKATFKDQEGNPVAVQLPHVNRDLCIGCGICEYKCPLASDAAIRVFVPTSLS